MKRRPERYHPRVPNRLRHRYSLQELREAWMGYRDVSWHTADRAAHRLVALDRITITAADRWCVALGIHLCFVFPELYEEAA